MFDLAIETYIKERGLGRSATLTHPVIGFGFKVTVECTNAAERNRVVTKGLRSSNYQRPDRRRQSLAPLPGSFFSCFGTSPSRTVPDNQPPAGEDRGHITTRAMSSGLTFTAGNYAGEAAYQSQPQQQQQQQPTFEPPFGLLPSRAQSPQPQYADLTQDREKQPAGQPSRGAGPSYSDLSQRNPEGQPSFFGVSNLVRKAFPILRDAGGTIIGHILDEGTVQDARGILRGRVLDSIFRTPSGQQAWGVASADGDHEYVTTALPFAHPIAWSTSPNGSPEASYKQVRNQLEKKEA